ncbi:extracellular solute-binding protein [Azospirillum argentinense]|uniref:Extracellular solute-binding protein n=1 Tax=Azospirillum argentinense TaxID=2970906 RepID=A0ABW8VFT9_9PROT
MNAGYTLNRRGFLIRSLAAAGATAGAGMVPGLLAPRSAQAAGALVYSGFGGSYEQAIRAAVLDPYAQARGIALATATGGSDVAKVSSMVKAGRTEWDLLDAQGTTLAQFAANRLLEPIDPAIAASADVFDRSLITPHSIPWYQFSLNLFWNSEAISGELQSWADVWNVQKYPGKRAFSNLPWFSLEVALLADGVPKDKLYPLDVDRAFASLDRIKKHAVFLSASGLANAISAQEVVTGIVNLARLKAVQKAGVKVRYSWEQAVFDIQQLVVPKGAPNKENAFGAIAYSLQPDSQKRVLELLGYTPTLKPVLAGIDPKQAEDLPGTDATRHKGFYLNADWWGKNGAAVSRRWQDWLAA